MKKNSTVPHSDFGGLNFKGLTSKCLLLMTLLPADDEKMKKKSYFLYPNFRKDLGFCILVESYVDSRSQNVCSLNTFCNSFRQVNEPACPILL